LIFEILNVDGNGVWVHDLRRKPPLGIPQDAQWELEREGWQVFRGNKAYIFDALHYDHEIEIKGKCYHGKYIRYNPEKKVVVCGQYDNGLETGKWKFYDKNGNVSIIQTYEKGKLIKEEKVKKDKSE